MSYELNTFIPVITDLIEDKLARKGLVVSRQLVSDLYEWAIDRAHENGLATTDLRLVTNRDSIINRIVLDLRTR